MQIGITTLSGTTYGGITYFRNLIPALAQIDTDNEYHIFVPHNDALPRLVDQANFLFHACSADVTSAWRRLCWEQLVLPLELKKRKIDILFTAKNVSVLLAHCKTVIAIRNMEPFAYQDYQNSLRMNLASFLRFRLSRASLKKADWIIAVSQSSKKQIETLFPHMAKQWDVVYNGNPVRDFVRTTSRSCEELPFLLSSSKYVAYANQLNLLQAYALLRRRRGDLPPLWLAGGIHDRRYFKQVQELIRKHGLEASVKILGLVSHDRMMDLYAAAAAFVFPSTLEACPNTLIEAMAWGLPIATSTTEPMPEICQDAAVYFDPFNPEDIAAKMESALFDEPLRGRLRRQALERCRFFNWEKAARETLRVFSKVRAESKPA